jgi:hypothetical protein
MIKVLHLEHEILAAKQLVQEVYQATPQPSVAKKASKDPEGSIWIGCYDDNILVGACRVTTQKHDVTILLEQYKQYAILDRLPDEFYECGRIVVAKSHRGSNVYDRLTIKACSIAAVMELPIIYKTAVKRMQAEGNIVGVNIGSFSVEEFNIVVYVCDPTRGVEFCSKRISKM